MLGLVWLPSLLNVYSSLDVTYYEKGRNTELKADCYDCCLKRSHQVLEGGDHLCRIGEPEEGWDEPKMLDMVSVRPNEAENLLVQTKDLIIPELCLELNAVLAVRVVYTNCGGKALTEDCFVAA